MAPLWTLSNVLLVHVLFILDTSLKVGSYEYGEKREMLPSLRSQVEAQLVYHGHAYHAKP